VLNCLKIFICLCLFKSVFLLAHDSPGGLLAAVGNGIVAGDIVPQPGVLLHLHTVLVGVVVGLVLVPVGVGPGVSVDPGEVCGVLLVIASYPEVLSLGQTGN